MANKRITDVDIIDSLNGDESFFVNQNSSIKQINKTNIVFGINNGGTNATTVEDARTNLDVYSKSEVNSLVTSSTLTIPADKWEQSNTYGESLYYADLTGLVPYVNANNKESIVFVSPVELPIENFNAYVENRVRACEQDFETINFIADTKPDIDITVNYTVFAQGG